MILNNIIDRNLIRKQSFWNAGLNLFAQWIVAPIIDELNKFDGDNKNNNYPGHWWSGAFWSVKLRLLPGCSKRAILLDEFQTGQHPPLHYVERIYKIWNWNWRQFKLRTSHESNVKRDPRFPFLERSIERIKKSKTITWTKRMITCWKKDVGCHAKDPCSSISQRLEVFSGITLCFLSRSGRWVHPTPGDNFQSKLYFWI